MATVLAPGDLLEVKLFGVAVRHAEARLHIRKFWSQRLVTYVACALFISYRDLETSLLLCVPFSYP